MGIELEFILPVVVGDVLHAVTRIEDVAVKPISLDPIAVWIVSATTIYNQRDEATTVWRNTVVCHRSPGQIDEDTQRGAVRK